MAPVFLALPPLERSPIDNDGSVVSRCLWLTPVILPCPASAAHPVQVVVASLTIAFLLDIDDALMESLCEVCGGA